MPKVTMYTTATCVYCHAEKQFFKEYGVEFSEVRVDSDPAAAQEMMQLSGQLGVPFTVIENSDKPEDKPEYILGFDQPRLTTILGIK